MSKEKKFVSVFDLKEGGGYFAVKDGRRGKYYTVKGGKLYNQNGDMGGDLVGCSWVPLDAAVTFEVHKKPAEEIEQKQIHTVIGMKEGFVYKTRAGRHHWEDGSLVRVCRVGNELYTVNKDNMKDQKLALDRVRLDRDFKLVGEVQERLLLPEPKHPTYWADSKREERKQKQEVKRAEKLLEAELV